MKTEIIVAGLGGQGILKFAELVVTAATEAGIYAQSYVHAGLSQLGGPVRSHIRIGEVYSPKIAEGGADLAVALERSEVFRLFPYLGPKTRVLLSDTELPPLATKLDHSLRPKEEDYDHLLGKTAGWYLLPVSSWLSEKGYPRITANMPLLGAVAALAPTLTVRGIQRVVNSLMTNHREANLDLLDTGYRFIRDKVPGLPVE